MRSTRKPAGWSSRSFDVAGYGLVRTCELGRADCAALDAGWIPRRRPTDVHAWRWTGLLGDGRDVWLFGARVDDELRVAWGTRKIKPYPMDRNFSAPTFRLDYLEIEPGTRGDGVTGALGLAIVAAEARRAGASSLLVLALSQAVPFYESFGAERVALKAWKLDPDLVPLLLGSEAFDDVAGRIEEHEDR